MITLENIKSRLVSLTYTTSGSDDGLITYISDNVQRSVILNLNVQVLPEDIEGLVIDKICGEFLMTKVSTGQDIGINLDAAVKGISEGDTNVQFETKNTPESRLNALIKWLIHGRDSAIMAHRCIRW